MTFEEPIAGATTVAVTKPVASMVIEEDGEARTINLCQRCYNEKLVQHGKQSQKPKDWREVVVRKAHRGRLWKIFGSEQFLCGMGEYFNLKRAWARKVLADAGRIRFLGEPILSIMPRF